MTKSPERKKTNVVFYLICYNENSVKDRRILWQISLLASLFCRSLLSVVGLVVCTHWPLPQERTLCEGKDLGGGGWIDVTCYGVGLKFGEKRLRVSALLLLSCSVS
jgi:hypothetical protein